MTQNEKDLLWLRALEDAGVDNWEGIDYAQEIYQNSLPDEEKEDWD